MASNDAHVQCRSPSSLVFLFVWLVAGCTTFSGHPDPVLDQDAELATLRQSFDAGAIANCIAAATNTCRDTIAAAKMQAIDMRFAQFETRMFRQTREAGFGATLATLGFTTAATLVHGSARAFSATAGLITGGREAFDKEILAQQTLLAIHSAMRLRRLQAATQIYGGLNLTYAQYNMIQLQHDLQLYEEAGNVLTALVGVNEIVGSAAKQAEAAMDNVVRVKLDPVATRIREAICRDATCSTRDPAAETRMQACISTWKLPDNTLLFDVFTKPEYAYIRPALAACMGL